MANSRTPHVQPGTGQRQLGIDSVLPLALQEMDPFPSAQSLLRESAQNLLPTIDTMLLAGPMSINDDNSGPCDNITNSQSRLWENENNNSGNMLPVSSTQEYVKSEPDDLYVRERGDAQPQFLQNPPRDGAVSNESSLFESHSLANSSESSPSKTPRKRRRTSEPCSSPDSPSWKSAALPKWQNNNDIVKHKLLDGAMLRTVSVGLDLVLDKGFKFSDFDNAFVGQKKNHFQVSYIISASETPAFVATDRGLLSVQGLKLDFYGIKLDAQDIRVPLDQSRVDRHRSEFRGVPVELASGSFIAKGSVPRLHFCQPTANNMRRKGKPNPDQRFFSLVASVLAVTKDGTEYCVASKRTPGLIVRAHETHRSNPRQFNNHDESLWRVGDSLWSSTPGDDGTRTAFHHGQVGINTSAVHPDAALTVHGNLVSRGRILRQAANFGTPTPLDTERCFQRIRSLAMVSYSGSSSSVRVPPAMGAVNLAQVIPEAHCSSSTSDDAGSTVASAVDLEWLLYESIGAIQSTTRQLDEARGRIATLEEDMAELHAQLRRAGRNSMSSSRASRSDSAST